MREVEQFIGSGILELYCLDFLSSEERAKVEQMAKLHPVVKNELIKVEETLLAKAESESVMPPNRMRNKVLLAIEAAELGLPPLLSGVSSVLEWLIYLGENKIGPEPGTSDLLWVDLPSSSNVVSYAVWAPKGVAVEEEHAEEEERLLMIKGSCNITVEGSTTTYHEGEMVFIPKGTLHRAEACSDEMMVLIGQRVTA